MDLTVRGKLATPDLGFRVLGWDSGAELAMADMGSKGHDNQCRRNQAKRHSTNRAGGLLPMPDQAQLKPYVTYITQTWSTDTHHNTLYNKTVRTPAITSAAI